MTGWPRGDSGFIMTESSVVTAARQIGLMVRTDRTPEDKYVTVGGLRLHYLDWGGDAETPMVCLHGRAQNAHSWDFTALAFGDRYRVLSLDQRGHGDSDWAATGDYDHEAFYRDIEYGLAVSRRDYADGGAPAVQ